MRWQMELISFALPILNLLPLFMTRYHSTINSLLVILKTSTTISSSKFFYRNDYYCTLDLVFYSTFLGNGYFRFGLSSGLISFTSWKQRCMNNELFGHDRQSKTVRQIPSRIMPHSVWLLMWSSCRMRNCS